MREMPKSIFEYVVCSRCGGSGEFSYNMCDGSRCYGCGGRGWKPSKRGAAAIDFYAGLQKKKAKDLKAGDWLFLDGKWNQILELSLSDGTFGSVIGYDENGKSICAINVECCSKSFHTAYSLTLMFARFAATKK